MIPVNRTFLPPIEEYQTQVKRVWDNGWLTNRGPLVKELEELLARELGTGLPVLMTNGTIPLQIALKLLGGGGEVITTPFSYVASTSTIVWEGCTPVFVDIHPEYLTIDESAIEAAITPRTTAILATHVFGNPCNVEAISTIAANHGLKVIYDGAHAFGVGYKGQSIFNHGDVSTCSFHATKLFHTGEGGCAFVPDTSLHHQIFYSHNFGHDGPLKYHGLGINGKMTEIQAAMGLSVLPHVRETVRQRKVVAELYDSLLSGTSLRPIVLREGTAWNYAYYPVIFHDEAQLLRVVEALAARNVTARRYFYPSLNTLPYLPYVPMPISESVSSRIACLPMFAGLSEKDVELIADIIINSL